MAYNLAGIALLALLVAVGAAYVLDRQKDGGVVAPPSLSDTPTVSQNIAGRDLTIPAGWFRFGEQIKTGFASQADLAFSLALTAEAAAVPVDVTLLPRSRARSSGALLDTVYLHQFAGGNVAGVPGLVGKPLVARDGYAKETVWYDPLSPAPFVAKCMDAVEPDKPARCLRTLNLASGIAAVVSFDATALPAWKQFDNELARWLDHIGAL